MYLMREDFQMFYVNLKKKNYITHHKGHIVILLLKHTVPKIDFLPAALIWKNRRDPFCHYLLHPQKNE